MKKIAKLSLVAAMAVAGLSTTSSAADLQEAIKGVDISGKVRYRMEEISTGQEDQDVNIDITTKVPVNDNFTFVSNLNIDNDNQEGSFEYAGQDTKNINLDKYYFQYVNGPVTGLVGTFEIPGRLTDGLTGSGAAALYNLGAFTVGYGAMYNSEASSEMINTAIAMGNVGPVALLGQYVDVADVMKVYNLKADASIEMLKVGVEYSEKELDTGAATDDERSTLKAYVSGSVGIVSAKLAYAKTGDNGAGSIDNAAETPAEWLLWQMGTKNNKDMDVIALDASVKVTDKVSLRAAYADGEVGSVDHEEILGQVSYKISKNLNSYLRYSEYEVGTADATQRGRIELQYTF